MSVMATTTSLCRLSLSQPHNRNTIVLISCQRVNKCDVRHIAGVFVSAIKAERIGIGYAYSFKAICIAYISADTNKKSPKPVDNRLGARLRGDGTHRLADSKATRVRQKLGKLLNIVYRKRIRGKPMRIVTCTIATVAPSMRAIVQRLVLGG